MSMVHLADPLYYKDLEEATNEHDRVLYELIVDQDVTNQDSRGWRRLKEPMVAPYPAQLPLFCQLMPAFILALTRSHNPRNPPSSSRRHGREHRILKRGLRLTSSS